MFRFRVLVRSLSEAISGKRGVFGAVTLGLRSLQFPPVQGMLPLFFLFSPSF